MHSVNKVNFATMHWFGRKLAPHFTNLQAQLKHLYCGRDQAEYRDCLIQPAGRINHQLMAVGPVGWREWHNPYAPHQKALIHQFHGSHA